MLVDAYTSTLYFYFRFLQFEQRIVEKKQNIGQEVNSKMKKMPSEKANKGNESIMS